MITIDVQKSEKLNCEYSGFITFEYNQKIIDKIKSYPFRNYNPDRTEWEIPADKLSDFVSSMNEFDIKFIGMLDNVKKKEIKVPNGFEFKTKPYEYQLEGFQFGLEHDRWFLGDQMGLGKTKQAIDIAVAKKLEKGYKHCLIVCGVNMLKWNWVNEIHTHSNEDCWILGQTQNSKGQIVIGSTKAKEADLDNIGWLPYFIITNVESFRTKEIADKISALCKNGTIGMCVADELHKMKNPQSQQSKGFLKCLPETRIAMTGTPLMNTPLDLYVILKWLGYENHPFYSFKQHYCVMGGFGGYEVIGYKNTEQLKAQLDEIMLRRLKDDVLDLPEKTYIDEYVEMTDNQAKIYKEVEMDIKTNIDQYVQENPNPLSILIRLRQATGYTGILSSTVQESAKLDRLEDLVEEIIENGEKVIIFSNWVQMTNEIYNRLGSKYNCGVITGDTPDNFRQAAVNMFQNENITKVMIGTIGAMGTGITLTAATNVIFVDEPWTMAAYEQAVDRAHRIGQKNNITIYNLMCKDTIDSRIHDIIQRKGALSDALVDGKVVGNKYEVLDYLLG